MRGISSFLTAGNLANLTIRNPATPRSERESTLSSASPLIRLATALEEQVGGNLVEQARDADNIISQLQSTKDNAKEARKARAKQKLEQIKAQLKMLRLLALNPEALARQIKQLSRMLAAAVREYASAGGTDAGVAAPNTAMMSAAAQTNAAQTDAGPTDTVPTTEAVSNASSTIASTEATATDGAVSTTEEDGPQNPSDAALQTEPVSPFETHGTPPSAAKGGDKDKEEFMRDVRFIKSMLKGLIEQARRKMENDPGAENDLKESEKALKKVETLLNDMAVDTTSPMPSVNIVA